MNSEPTRASVQSAADHFPWDLLIPVLPHLFGLLIVATVLLALGRRGLVRLVGRITKFGFLGIEIGLAEDLERAAADKGVELPAAEAKDAVHRLAQAAPILSCARLLWVDDNPTNNVNEMRLLRRMCVSIDLAESTAAARKALKTSIYDIVLSDMSRGRDERAGEAILKDVGKAPLSPAIIYYVGRKQPTPDGAFGLTVRPDELFRLIVAALRKRRS